jgi:hypothetical protein
MVCQAPALKLKSCRFRPRSEGSKPDHVEIRERLANHQASAGFEDVTQLAKRSILVGDLAEHEVQIGGVEIVVLVR